MKKRKFLLVLLAMVLVIVACALVFVGCDDHPDQDVDTPDVPLGDVTCEHTAKAKVSAKAATCISDGNVDYWYCSACSNLFSDEACTTKTTLAAVTISKSTAEHSYTTQTAIPATAANCVTNTTGMQAHFECELCHAYFDANKVKTTQAALTIAITHDLAHTAKVDAVGCNNGNKEYWQCNDCHVYFSDALAQNIIPSYAQTILKAPHTLTEMNDTDCFYEGDTYWQCEVCEKCFDDNIASNEIEPMAVERDEPQHLYGDFAYNYTSKQYERVCSRDDSHVDTQTAGVENFPYLVNDEASLKAAIALGGYIKLTSNIEIASRSSAVINKSVNIDLNNFTLSSSANTQAVLFINKDVAATVDVKNGTIYNGGNNYIKDGGTNASPTYAINSSANTDKAKASKLKLNNVVFNNNDSNPEGGIFEGADGRNRLCGNICVNNFMQAELINCTFNGGYDAVAIKADAQLTMTNCVINDSFVPVQGNGSKHNTVISLTNNEITSYYGIYHPQDGIMTIEGGFIHSVGTAVEVRAGQVTITGASLTSTLHFTSGAYGSANSTSGCAVAVSQHSTDKAIDVTIAGCELNGVYAVYEKDFMNDTARDVISITLGEGNTYNGGVYSENCSNIGTETTPYIVTNIDMLNAAIAKGGYIKLLNNINITEAISLTNSINIDLNGKTITSPVNGFELTESAVLNLKNGNIVATQKGIDLLNAASVSLENVNISAQDGVWSRSSGKIDIAGGEINVSRYGILAAPANPIYDVEPDYYIDVKVIGTTIISSNNLGCELHIANATFENVTINSKSTCVLVFRGTTLTMTDCNLTSEINSGVQGNGTENKNSSSCGIDTVITLNNCIIDAVCAVYHPQVGGKLTVNGGTFTAKEVGIEVRAGNAELNNVTVISTSDAFDIEANGSGSTTMGVALAVSQHTTNGAIKIKLNGATLTGIYAMYEKDVQDDDQPKDITIELTGENTFNGGVYSENCDNIENKEPETPQVNG